MQVQPYQPRHTIRFVTASALFDGHDASINIMRRILQDSGAEVIHLGHNRSVEEIVEAAIAEDVQGIAVSSYQGGHVEFFQYLHDLLQQHGVGHIKIFGGGGGVIIPEEIRQLEAYGICKIFSPEDGAALGLQGMINYMLEQTDFPTVTVLDDLLVHCKEGITTRRELGQLITYAELKHEEAGWMKQVKAVLPPAVISQGEQVPVLGITGTGGAGKSSLTDELVRRFLHADHEKQIAVISVDPSKRRSGGALLGDRIRMNSIHHSHIYMRSMATRDSGHELSHALQEAIQLCKWAGYDLIILETSGIGQGDSRIVEYSDVTLYVMTAEYGAPSQLEKIEMLDVADIIAINKFDRKGAEDALRDVRKQVQRNRNWFHLTWEELPVFATMASQFNDQGVNHLFAALAEKLKQHEGFTWSTPMVEEEAPANMEHPAVNTIIPPERENYLQEIATTVKQYHGQVEEQVAIARQLYQVDGVLKVLEQEANSEKASTQEHLVAMKQDLSAQLLPEWRQQLESWDDLQYRYHQPTMAFQVRDKEIQVPLYTTSLAGLQIPKISLPRYEEWGERLRWLLRENVPGAFPYTAGVFPLKRQEEEPTRQFAGEGTPERTNRRFHFLSAQHKAKRLSTAFDSVTLYGEDPDERPDIYGKIGESGVSICTLDDMKKLYAGFDLCHPSTSVSMTINGPAPIILAMFLNTAIDQQVERFENEVGRKVNQEEYARIKVETLQRVRGTVQADILKEDQGQNTCIFSTPFALKLMGDIQEYFIQHQMRNYYSVSISGYHIAEAGANPITQLAFTLANGFTYVEYYLSRGMKIDDFAPNLSFFFSNGLDPEYSVIGRVARRIWAIVMKYKYQANERSQKLKYHIQTSGRSLHAQEMQFNDIRTTLQALLAIYDHCNSLHTNAYDEAITTPTEESVRRAMAIQLIIQRELGLANNENPLQGSFIIEDLTQLVEEAVLLEFTRLSARGGVLGAMERQYQRSKIQDESMLYEIKKHNGELPIIGVNTFLPTVTENEEKPIPLARASKEEKVQQITNLRQFQELHQQEARVALVELKAVALRGENIFSQLMETVKVASLGQITASLYEVGGQYRRNM